MLRTRVVQFGAAAFVAAVLVTNVDVRSLVNTNEPPMPTFTAKPPIHITTMEPSSTPTARFTEPLKTSGYEATSSCLESSAEKSVYTLDLFHDQAAIETTRPGASPKPPKRPLETNSDSVATSGHASSPPRQPRMDESSTADERSNGTFDSTNLPTKHWIPKSIQDALSGMKSHVLSVLVEVKQHVSRSFPGMAPSFGMVAWVQFQYMQYLHKIANAENFNFLKLKLASHSDARARELETQTLLKNYEMDLTDAVEKLEALVAASEIWKRNAAYEVARLQSAFEEGQHALTRVHQRSKQKLEEMADENAHLDSSIKEKDETITTMGAEARERKKEVKALIKERDKAWKDGVDAAAAHKATIAQLNTELEESNNKCKAAEADTLRQETVATEAREQLEAAEETASQAGKTIAEAAKLVEASEQRILQQQARNDTLADSLATNSSALVEAIAKAGKAKEIAERTEKALQEHIAELVEKQKERAARSTAPNKKLEDELAGERGARLRVVSNDGDQRIKNAEEGQRRAEEGATRAKGEADHLVRSQLGQLNRAKALNDAYRAKYGILDDFKTTKASPPLASNDSSSAPDANHSGTVRPSTNEANEYKSQSLLEVDPVSAVAGVSQALPRSTSLSN